MGMPFLMAGRPPMMPDADGVGPQMPFSRVVISAMSPGPPRGTVTNGVNGAGVAIGLDGGIRRRPAAQRARCAPAEWPLIATRDDVETAANAIAEALDAVASELGVTAAA